MRAPATARKNSTTRMTKALEPLLDVVSVKALPGFRIQVAFEDGVKGIVDLSARVQSKRAGVFSALADPELFKRVFIEHGAVTWPGELDLAPDAMYDEIKKNGIWTLT
jgi:hypothetical protein